MYRARKERPPCIRGLKRFEKTGCPEKSWDGSDGCPAWVHMDIARKGNPLERKPDAKCLDHWKFEMDWAHLGILEGNQAAIETLRNNLTTTDENGYGVPKPDPATLAVFNILSLQAYKAGIRRAQIEAHRAQLLTGETE